MNCEAFFKAEMVATKSDNHEAAKLVKDNLGLADSFKVSNSLKSSVAMFLIVVSQRNSPANDRTDLPHHLMTIASTKVKNFLLTTWKTQSIKVVKMRYSKDHKKERRLS